MTKATMKATGGRKMLITMFLAKEEIAYLDKRIKKTDPVKNSRSALLRFLIREAMEHNML